MPGMVGRRGLIIGDPIGDRIGDRVGDLLTTLSLFFGCCLFPAFRQSALPPGVAQSCAPYVSWRSASKAAIGTFIGCDLSNGVESVPSVRVVLVRADSPPSTSLLACAPTDGPALNFLDPPVDVTGLESMMKPVFVDSTGGWLFERTSAAEAPPCTLPPYREKPSPNLPTRLVTLHPPISGLDEPNELSPSLFLLAAAELDASSMEARSDNSMSNELRPNPLLLLSLSLALLCCRTAHSRPVESPLLLTSRARSEIFLAKSPTPSSLRPSHSCVKRRYWGT